MKKEQTTRTTAINSGLRSQLDLIPSWGAAACRDCPSASPEYATVINAGGLSSKLMSGIMHPAVALAFQPATLDNGHAPRQLMRCLHGRTARRTYAIGRTVLPCTRYITFRLPAAAKTDLDIDIGNMFPYQQLRPEIMLSGA
jgi:hypothetical protein